MRIILLVLSLVICFLVGVLYGMDREKVPISEPSNQPIQEQVEEPAIIEPPVEEAREVVTLIQTGDTPAYKAASALETVVSFFYEVIVEILYQISRLFV